MRKIILLVLVLFAGTMAFSDVFPNSEKITEDFLTRGSYVKVVKDKKNIVYISKLTVVAVHIDENDIEIEMCQTDEKQLLGDVPSYNIKKWNITSDENGNIIITRK